jgi:hypothetical protein
MIKLAVKKVSVQRSSCLHRTVLTKRLSGSSQNDGIEKVTNKKLCIAIQNSLNVFSRLITRTINLRTRPKKRRQNEKIGQQKEVLEVEASCIARAVSMPIIG